MADLRGDGIPWLLLRDKVWALDGSASWDWTDASYPLFIVVDIEADGDAEVVGCPAGWVEVMDSTGEVVVDKDFLYGGPHAPCAGDINGDGLPELVYTHSRGVVAVDSELRTLWELRDTSEGGQTCAMADLDGDGRSEVVLGLQSGLVVLDQDGKTLWTDSTSHATFGLQYNLVADVDGDGRADLVDAGTSTDGSSSWLRVYRHAGEGWTEAGDWPCSQHPACGDPAWWTHHNGFRSQPTSLPESHITWELLPDWEIEVEDVCQEGCESTALLQVSAPVANAGAVEATVLVDLVGVGNGVLDSTTLTLAPGQAQGVLFESLPRRGRRRRGAHPPDRGGGGPPPLRGATRDL